MSVLDDTRTPGTDSVIPWVPSSLHATATTSDDAHSPDTELEFDVRPTDSIPDPVPGSQHGTECIPVPLVHTVLQLLVPLLCGGSPDTTEVIEPDMSLLSLLS
jgi:hypothetical protein